jgi:hypothetical protein
MVMQCGLNDAVGPVFIEDGDMKGLSEGLRQQVDEGGFCGVVRWVGVVRAVAAAMHRLCVHSWWQHDHSWNQRPLWLHVGILVVLF